MLLPRLTPLPNGRPSLEQALAIAEAAFELRKRRASEVNPYAEAEAWHEGERRRRGLMWRSAVLYGIALWLMMLQFGITPL
jgi:hypothetical protein